MTNSPWHVEIDRVDRDSWDQLITQFDDANICQTWSYGISSGRDTSHIIIKEGSTIRGCCQLILRRLPLLNIRIAHIKWGPLCLKKGETFRPEILLHLVRAIKEEYAIKRGCLLRIEPHAVEERKELLRQILENEGFKRAAERPYRTLKLDLSPPLADLRNNFLQKWRNCLNKAERSEIQVVEGTGDDLYGMFLSLATEMVERKNLNKAHVDDVLAYRRIQGNLPESLKMKIMIGKMDAEPVCAAICSALGDTGVYLFGATSQKGLKLNASYILQWRMIQWMKERGVRYYDLGAFNAKRNPGVYHFKLGISGKSGWEETFLGEFFGCFNLSGKFGKLILVCSMSLSEARMKWSTLKALKTVPIQKSQKNL